MKLVTFLALILPLVVFAHTRFKCSVITGEMNVETKAFHYKGTWGPKTFIPGKKDVKIPLLENHHFTITRDPKTKLIRMSLLNLANEQVAEVVYPTNTRDNMYLSVLLAPVETTDANDKPRLTYLKHDAYCEASQPVKKTIPQDSDTTVSTDGTKEEDATPQQPPTKETFDCGLAIQKGYWQSDPQGRLSFIKNGIPPLAAQFTFSSDVQFYQGIKDEIGQIGRLKITHRGDYFDLVTKTSQPEYQITIVMSKVSAEMGWDPETQMSTRILSNQLRSATFSTPIIASDGKLAAAIIAIFCKKREISPQPPNQPAQAPSSKAADA